MNRQKRLAKGIESLKKQMEIHREKRDQAKEQGKIELAEYYDKEIEKFDKEEKKKQRMMERE